MDLLELQTLLEVRDHRSLANREGAEAQLGP